MLTNNDLQAIGKVVDQKLGKKLDLKLKPVTKSIQNLQKDMIIVKKNIIKIKKDLETSSNFHDKENLKAIKRIKIVEKHLNLPEPNFLIA